MPLFSKSQPAPAPEPVYEEKPRRGLFGSKHETAPAQTNTAHNNHSSGGGGGLFNRSHEDSSITEARQRVAAAEASERGTFALFLLPLCPSSQKKPLLAGVQD